jgi:hypothetical protein
MDKESGGLPPLSSDDPESHRSTPSSNEVNDESDHGADQQDVNEKSCHVKRKEATRP